MAEMKKICAQCGVKCPKCGKVEFYAAEEDMVTCPVCGSVHSRHEKCAICALNAAYENHVKL